LDTQVLVAATTAGVMLSQDGGRTWTNESLRGGVVVNGGASFSAAGLPYGLPASDIVLVRSLFPNDLAVLYAAIPGQGVFRATLASFAFLGNVSNLQLPLQWTATNNSGPTNSLNGIATSYSGPTNISQTTRILLAGMQVDVVYAALYQPDSALQRQLGSNGNNFIYALFRSTDQGNTWISMGTPRDSDGPVDGGGQVQHGALVADSFDPNVAYISGDLRVGTHLSWGKVVNNEPEGNVLRATFNPADGTTSYDALVGYHVGDPVEGKPHADSRQMVISGHNLFYTCDGGIYRLNNFRLDDGNDPVWKSLNGNMFITELYSVTYDSDFNIIMGGAQDNGTNVQTDDGGLEWQQWGDEDGGWSAAHLHAERKRIRRTGRNRLFLQGPVGRWESDTDLLRSFGHTSRSHLCHDRCKHHWHDGD
jgi:hypothetical protein